MLQIIVNSSNNIDISAEAKEGISADIEQGIGRFADRLTRVEVHIGDESNNKNTENDKRCMLEARPDGMEAVNVTVFAGSVQDAVKSAVLKLETVLERSFEKRGDPKGRPPAGRPE